MNESVEITFDPKQFTTALQAIVTKLGAMEQAVVKTGVKTNVTAMMMAKGMMMATAGINLAVSTANKLLSHIPEVGKSFQIAGDIIMQNLLWPLRKELIPLLQKMLNWVRDHRAMFVQWGSVLANIFRALKTIVVGFFEMVQRIWTRVAGIIQRIFGGTMKSVSEILNLILFKITAVAMFVMTVIENIFDYLLDLFDDLSPAIKEIIVSLSKLWDMMGGGDSVLDGITKKLQELKIVFGLIAMGLTEGVNQALDEFVTNLKMAGIAYDGLMAMLAGHKGIASAKFEQLGVERAALGQRTKTSNERLIEKAKRDAGDYTRDYMKQFGVGVPTTSTKKETNVTISHLEVHADGNANAKEIATDTGKTLVRTFKDLELRTGKTGVMGTLTPGAGFGL